MQNTVYRDREKERELAATTTTHSLTHSCFFYVLCMFILYSLFFGFRMESPFFIFFPLFFCFLFILFCFQIIHLYIQYPICHSFIHFFYFFFLAFFAFFLAHQSLFHFSSNTVLVFVFLSSLALEEWQ